MEYKEITKEVKIPVLGLGTWGMGGFEYIDNSRDKEEIEAVHFAIKLGMTHIDTAEIYAAGHSEEIVGEALKIIKGKRKNIFLATKVWPHNFSYANVLKAAENSLQRLKTDYIDLYYLHWPNPSVSIKETMRAMEQLVKAGKVKHVGVSNFSVEELEEAQETFAHKIVANQVHYSLLHREPEKELLPYCQKKGVMLVAYTPLEKGAFLTLKDERGELLDELAKNYGKTRNQVALNWLVYRKNVIAIPKASDPEHLKENADAAGWKLGAADIKKLDIVFS